MKPEIPLPVDWCSRMGELLGAESGVFFEFQASASPVSIRLNPAKLVPISFEEMTPVEWSPHGRYLRDRPTFTLDPLFHAGAYYVQEAGSMLIDELIRSIPIRDTPLYVLDLCAAPGGKSLGLLDSIANNGILVANEPIPLRNDALRHNLARWGRSNVIVTQSEARHFSKQERFDVILVDAPCSGEGLFRKDHAARSEWTLERAEVCAVRQQQILTDIFPALKPGGYLIYSTCTYNPAENDGCIHDFISKHPVHPIVVTPPAKVESTQYGWQAYPHRINGEGFYCALLQKAGDWEEKEIGSKSTLKTPPRHWIPFVREVNNMLFREEKIGTVMFPSLMAELLDSLTGQVQIRQYGTPLGVSKGELANPSAELALSQLIAPAFDTFDVTKEQALQFLSGETRFVPGAASGWHLIRHGGLGLGWAKWVGNRWNNAYPQPWRIRMKLNL
ncbi:MAG: methyltransferase RsmF C-terminal domain-like protein [Bacteroidota bacterium]